MFEKSFMRDALGKPLVEKRFYRQLMSRQVVAA